MNVNPNFDLIFQKSESSTSLQTLYRGYRYFHAEFGTDQCVIAYVNTPTAWVGASDPVLTNPEHLLVFLKMFSDAAKKKQKKACILPTSKKTADAVRALGYYAIEIGREPWYRIEESFTHAVPNTKALLARGAFVEAFDPTAVTVGQRWELDDLTDQWLESRKMADIGFLNRVEPWTLLKHKRFFRAMYHGRQIGYLAAIPIQAKNAWYFVDLIRTPESPVGTTELLIAESAKILQKEGVTEITLGMSPFADVEESEKKVKPLTYWAFERVHHRSNSLYGFKTLLQYKQKFKPAYWEPNFFVSLEKTPGPRVLYGLFCAVFPKGVVHTLLSTLKKVSKKSTFENLYAKTLSPTIVPKTPPTSWVQYIANARFSTFLTVLNLVAFYASTDLEFKLRPAFANRYAYSWENFYSINPFPYGFLNLIIASFVHWDVTHLFFNVILTMVCMSFLECALGGTFLLITYFSGLLFSNPLTSLVLYPALRIFSASSVQSFLAEKDVGCSLGVFACLGVLFFIMKRTNWLLIGTTLAVAAYSITMNSFLSISHITAMLIGLGLAKLYTRDA